MPSIQAAVDAAGEGNTVLLSSGLFSGPGNRDVTVKGKNLIIRSETETRDSIVDCEGLHRGFLFDGPFIDERTILHGVWIRNGWSLAGPLSGQGGGALVINGAHPTVLDCTFEACNQHGIGYQYLGTPLGRVQDCLFLNNRSDGDGGGFWGGAVLVERCTFLGNTAGVNGGAARITHTMRDCLVVGNAATNLINGGGGVYAWPSATIDGCTFVGNTANQGGGVLLLPGITVVSNSVFWGNTAPFGGQQIHQGAPTVGSTATAVRYCDVQGGADGIETDPWLTNGPRLEHLIDADPGFLDPANGDYRLGSDSPCLDAGDPDLVASGRGDLEAQPRIAGGRIDMGADERWERFVLGLVSPGISGLPNRIRADHAPPDALVAFLWGTAAGTLPVPLPACPDLALAIADPLVLSVRAADGTGSATYSQHAPSVASGSTVLLQALFLVPGSACGASNLVVHTYP